MAYRRSLWKLMLDEFKRLEQELRNIEEDFYMKIKGLESMRGCITPLYNIYESGDELIITADLPGTSRDEIDLTVSEDYLKIEAPCRSPARRMREGRYLLHIRLPVEIEPESVKARYKEGVLEINAKKKIKGFKIKVE
ncbi:MAG: Hsp20/alpha crystallin family protein [Aigarchaeota archaeon]|nr:Hsp20/alpha crystallin family protein [Aigarchaeota archaeon]MCX8193442.1 Hsp20/alpha crystallin family protein [Nitrososphaeria archaeon]MDW7985826.1 Hsp20/alpha crystallin family protein [Nitrososphaerota archaeon]